MTQDPELAQQRGASSLDGDGWSVRLLPAPPLISPARQFIFPQAIPGEEEAMARGSVWASVSALEGGSFLAQCAIGFAAAGVAAGLWPSPNPSEFLLAAGGYAYTIAPNAPERTALLSLRPVIAVAPTPGRLVLVGYHHVLVHENDGATWQSDRLSWEGVTLTGFTPETETLHGTGWDMIADEELPFELDLRTRHLIGGGYRRQTPLAKPAR